MNNNIKIEDIKSEPLTTEQIEFLVSGLFNMMSKENTQFVSKKKYDELESKINNAIEYINTHSEMTDIQIYGIENTLAFRGSLEDLLNILQGKNNE